MHETTVSSALCGVMEQALVEKGINPTLARELAQRACMPVVGAASMAVAAPVKKAKRKVSKYARAYGAAYRALKRKHPRAQHKTLVKRAHTMAKRQMKK